MTREETRDCLKLIQANYENFHPADMTLTLNLWAESFASDPVEKVTAAIWSIIQTSTSNFAPNIGQIRKMMADRNPSNIPNESQAWELVYEALSNSNYHANEEFNKLPADIRRAVGGAETLREWAAMPFDSITVAESQFKRTYRAIAEKSRQFAIMPENMRPQIEEAPVARIEDKEEAQHFERASEEFISGLMERFRDEL